MSLGLGTLLEPLADVPVKSKPFMARAGSWKALLKEPGQCTCRQGPGAQEDQEERLERRRAYRDQGVETCRDGRGDPQAAACRDAGEEIAVSGLPLSFDAVEKILQVPPGDQTVVREVLIQG